MDHEGAKRREPDSDDEQSKMPTPPESPDKGLQDDEPSPSEMNIMPQHGLPMDTTSNFQMAPELSFTGQGQQTPEFRSSQPEMSHRSLAGTPITGPILTPVANQFMDHSQFTESPSAEQMQSTNQTPVHAQAEPSASFTDWAPTFQQNIFSPVDYHGAGRQVHPQMAYPTYPTYPSSHAQDISSTYTVPDLARSREADLMNMANLPFRTGTLSHPHVVHRPDGGAGPNM